MDQHFLSPQFKKSLQIFQDYLKNGYCDFLDAEELTDIAEYYQTKGETEKSMAAIDLALKMFPGATFPLCFKARVAMVIENNPEKAKKILEDIADKTAQEYAYTMAEIMISEKKTTDADRYLKEYMESLDDDTEDYILDCALLFADYGEFTLAEKWLKQSTLTDDDDYKDIQARILMNRGKFDESEQLFNELIDRDPYSNTYWNRLASSQYLQNNIKDSIISSEYALAINPQDEEALLNKANGLFYLGNLQEAQKYYEQFLQQQPENGVVLQEMAFLMSKQGMVKEALAYLDKAEQTGIDKYRIEVTRGYVELENNNKEEAEKHFEKAIHDSHSASKVIFQVAIAVYDVGYTNAAKNILSVILTDDNPDWKDGYAYYARCCFEQGEDKEYAEALKIAVDKNPEEARMILGDLYPKGMDPQDYLHAMPILPEQDELTM